jgi:hypothetical protein
MTENKQKSEKKKTGLIWRIFRWIGLSFLILIFLTMLVFHAPWKIITLLAIVLVVCIFLPERHRKWFWLVDAIALIVVVVWIFLPEDNKDWHPFIFDEEIAAYEKKFTVPDEQNAAVIYNRLLQDFDPKTMGLKFLPPGGRRKVLSEPWTNTDYPELAKWLHGHENTIGILLNVSKIESCRFTGNYKISVTDELQINRNMALKSWTVLLLISANNDIAESRIEEALFKFACALQLTDHLYQQKRITDFLIGFGIEGLILRPINRFVIEEQLNNEQLEIISDNLTSLENNWPSDFSQCLEYDKLFIKNTFCSLVFEMDSKGGLRYSRNPAAAIWERLRLRKLQETYWQKKSMKAYAIFAWFTLPATPQKAAEIVEKTCKQYHAMADPGFNWDKRTLQSPSLEFNTRFLIWLIARRTSRTYSGFHDIYLKRLAQRRGLRLLVAIKRYHNESGIWPASLDEMKSSVPSEAFLDPVCNDAFVYVRDGGTFRLYSKGINCTDEAGQRDYIRALDKYQDDIAIWPLPKYEIGVVDND